jgi:hypothetical protein
MTMRIRWLWLPSVRRSLLLALLPLLPLLAGCLTSDPVVPLPTVVYVPNPAAAEPAEVAALGPAALKERYSASPNANPQGLGVYGYVWPQSRMALMTWPMQQQLEARNRIALRRSPERHAAVLQERRAFFEDNVVFWGMLYSYNPFPVDPDWYLPEGVYLEDDRGRIFRPTRVGHADVQFFFEEYYRSIQHAPGEPAVQVAYPEFVFPKGAITPETRAVTLYLAAVQRQMGFTWVFDETYVPSFERFDPDSGVGLERVMRSRPAAQ